MTVSPDLYLVLCALAPFGAALATPVLHRAFGTWTGVLLALLPAVICLYLAGFVPAVIAGEAVRMAVPWVPALGLELSFLVDGLSLTFALLIAGIGALILVYSGTYLEGYPQRDRFLAYMMAFMGSMLGLVLSDNSVALYTFWELTSVTSFLLIGYDHTRQAARRAAIQALVITNIGGLALLVAAVALYLGFGSWDLSALRTLGGSVRESGLYPLILGGVLIAGFTKSAQFPLHFWLPAAMQAPTPVSAYLHSATMVQAGVYLFARMTPTLGGTPAWSTFLAVFGGVTLAWGAVNALRQTDLKQMLAQSTVASLGMLVLLLGIGTEAAVAGAVVYFVAHALYKATLFLVAGVIESETGARDITILGGLRDRMTITFLVAAAGAASMIGIPPALGSFAKEETYAAVAGGDAAMVLLLVVMVAGNALMAAVALAIALKPFLGALLATPQEPGQGHPALLLGPILLALLGLAAGWSMLWFGATVTGPMTSAILGQHVEHHAQAGIDLANPLLLLSVLTWAIGALVYWQLGRIRAVLRRTAERTGWSFEAGFDAAMFGLVRASAAITRLLHHGRLELYLIVVFALFALSLLLPPILDGRWPPMPRLPDLTFYEWGTVLLAAAGILTVLAARTRLFAIIALGIQGLAVSLLFMLFGAPDLSFTQFMVEILSVVIFALVMTRLQLETDDRRSFATRLRDGVVAVAGGLGIALTLLVVLDHPFDARLSDFFAAYSARIAHGHNIVNVILVDFRGLDTLGEISVIMAAGIAILALIRQHSTRAHRSEVKDGRGPRTGHRDGGATPEGARP